MRIGLTQESAYHCGLVYMVLVIHVSIVSVTTRVYCKCRGNEYIVQLLTLTKVRRNHIDLDISTDETHSSGLISVDTAQPGTKIAFSQVCVGP